MILFWLVLQTEALLLCVLSGLWKSFASDVCFVLSVACRGYYPLS